MAVLSLGLPNPSEISHTDVLLFHRSYKYAESAPHPEFDADHSAQHFGCCCHWIQRSRILQSHPIQRSGSQEAAFFLFDRLRQRPVRQCRDHFPETVLRMSIEKLLFS